MAKDEFVTETDTLSDILFDKENVVHSVRVMSEEMLYCTYSKTDNSNGAVMGHTIVAFTTAHCRLRLYEELERLQERCMYFDTDSVIYLTRPED